MSPTLGALPVWEGPFPSLKGSLDVSFILPVPFKADTLLDRPQALRYLSEIQRFLQKEFGRRHEIILAPYGPGAAADIGQGKRKSRGLKALFQWRALAAANVGDAVRGAAFRSRGRILLVGNLEYQYPPIFFREALWLLGKGAPAVCANRRLEDSEFSVPANILNVTLRHHALGLAFNALLRRFVGLKTTDGLSGAYAMKRAVALRLFSRLSCPGFLYEIELNLIAMANGWRFTELPARLRFGREKPFRRLVTEVREIVEWVPRLRRQFKGGKYEFLRLNNNHLFADDWGMSRSINEGVLRIARLGHLKYVSVMAGLPQVRYRLEELKRVKGMDLGIHFHLSLPPSSLGKVFLRWGMWRLGLNRKFIRHVREELSRQIAWLKSHGIRPRHFDSHHHVHALPGLLDAVADILRKEGVRYVRVPCDPTVGWSLRRRVIYWMGRLMAPAVKRHGFRYLSLWYPRPEDISSYNDMVFSMNRVSNSEVLVHPAAYDDIAESAPYDPYREGRVAEYRVLRLLALALRLPRP